MWNYILSRDKLTLETHPILLQPRIARLEDDAFGVEFINPPPMAFEWHFHVFKHTMPLPGARNWNPLVDTLIEKRDRFIAVKESIKINGKRTSPVSLVTIENRKNHRA